MDKLIDNFVNAATRHMNGLLAGDPRKANPAADAIREIVTDLANLGSAGEKAIAMLMDHESLAVRCWAARKCLFIPDCEAKAKATIEAIAKGGGMTGFEAEMLLEVWKEGELHNPWPTGQATCRCPACRKKRAPFPAQPDN